MPFIANAFLMRNNKHQMHANAGKGRGQKTANLSVAIS